MGYLSDSVDYSHSSLLKWFTDVGMFSRISSAVKLHAMHESVVPLGVTVLLWLCNPPRRGRGESAKPGLLYPLVWIPCYDTVN
jgi:hypothetical protein